MDCRYCHTTVEKSWFSNIPSASTCMNCHNQVLKDDPRLALVRDSATNNMPIPWVQIHRLPDYVYFNHAVHVRRGISCVECHGRVDQMDEVHHAKPLSMSVLLELPSRPGGVHPARKQGHGSGLAMEHQRGRRRANAGDQRRRIGARLARAITPKLFSLPPMRNLRFTIYDLRWALPNACSADWQSAVSQIGNLRMRVSLQPAADCQSAKRQVANLRYKFSR